MPLGLQVRLVAFAHAVRKAKVDPERLRAKLKAMYRKEFRKEARAAIAEAIDAIRDLAGAVDAAEVDLVMSTLSRRLGAENLGTTLVGQSTAYVRDVFHAAAHGIRAAYKLTTIDHDAIKLIAEHDLVWIKDHVDDKLMPKFREVTTEVMETGYSRRRLAEHLADELSSVVDADVDYWESLADHTVTKARNMGRLAAIEEAGIEKVVIVATMDGRTSQICRDMNGRVIAVSVARDQAEALKAAKAKDELKNAMIWPKRYQGKSGDLKSFAGDGKHFALPPYHYKCRTDYDAYFDDVSVRAEYGQEMRSDDEEMLSAYSADEHWNRAQSIVDRAEQADLGWNNRDWERDLRKAMMVKHAASEFGDNAARYHARAKESVMNADEVTARVYRPQRKGGIPRIQYTYYSKTTDAMVVVDDNGVIRGCYKTEDVDQTVAGQARERLWLKRKKD